MTSYLKHDPAQYNFNILPNKLSDVIHQDGIQQASWT